MQYYTSNIGGVYIVYVCDSSTGRITSVWPGTVPGSYNMMNELVSILPGPNGSFSPYQVKMAFLTEVQRADVLAVLQNLQDYTSSF